MNSITRFNNSLGLHILLLCLCLVLLQTMQSELMFQRTDINNGEIWRIMTGNLVHTNTNHLLINLAGLAFMWPLFRGILTPKILHASLLLLVLAVGIGIYLFSEQLSWYAGLSGALYGLFIVAASLALRCKNYLVSLPILIGIPAKILWDSTNGGLSEISSALINAPIATDAHIYGLIAGILVSFGLAAIYKPDC